MIVAATRADSSYEERACWRCFDGRVYDGLRDVLGHRAGGGVHLSEAEAPLAVARRAVLSGPEFLYRNSGFFCVARWG